MNTAQNGSKHIEFLLHNDLLDTAPTSKSFILDTAYAVHKIGISLKGIDRALKGTKVRGTTQSGSASTTQHLPEEMLLSKDDGALIASCLEVPELGPEVERAVWQVERSIKAQAELKEEKAELESAKKS